MARASWQTINSECSGRYYEKAHFSWIQTKQQMNNEKKQENKTYIMKLTETNKEPKGVKSKWWIWKLKKGFGN